MVTTGAVAAASGRGLFGAQRAPLEGRLSLYFVILITLILAGATLRRQSTDGGRGQLEAQAFRIRPSVGGCLRTQSPIFQCPEHSTLWNRASSLHQSCRPGAYHGNPYSRRRHKFTLTPEATCTTITCMLTPWPDLPSPRKDQSTGLLPNISRRRFARKAAAVAASLSSPPGLLGSSFDLQEQPARTRSQEASESGLTAEQIREVEARLAGALRDFGSHMSDEKRQRLRRILVYNEKMLASIRTFHLENGDSPATVLKNVDGRSARRGSDEGH